MSHLLEQASSARARCRGCAQPIARGELRFGERLPNPFAEGEMTLWFHPLCAAYKRPEALLELLQHASDSLPERAELERAAQRSAEHRRLPRIDGAERAPGAQAKCRACQQPIARGAWRIRLVYYEEGRFSAGGFVHLECRRSYFESEETLGPLLHFSTELNDAERAELCAACRAPDPAAPGADERPIRP